MKINNNAPTKNNFTKLKYVKRIGAPLASSLLYAKRIGAPSLASSLLYAKKIGAPSLASSLLYAKKIGVLSLASSLFILSACGNNLESRSDDPDAANVSEITQSSDGTDSSEDTQSPNTTNTSEDAQSPNTTNNSEDAQSSNTTNISEDAQSPNTTNNSEDVQSSNVADTSEDTQSPNTADITEDTQSSDESLPGDSGSDGSSTSTTPVNIIDDAYRTTYEVFVYSFYDSDGDGIGDLQGLIKKLDYINDGDDSTTDDLGCNEIWLMPICPSTTYHKYDVIDYCDVDPEYGTLDDYKELLDEAHKRGIRIINDMVMNHTSSQHQWFKDATEYLKSLPEGAEPDIAKCPYADYYHFSREPQTGYEKCPGSDWYYECRFWSEMPDLNLDNKKVQKEFSDIAKFWLDLGTDGFRMDALTAFTTDDIAVSTEELTPFVNAVKEMTPDAYIVGEAWTNSASYAKFYSSGIDSLFDFDYSGSEGTIAKCAKGKLNPAKYVQQQIDEDELFSSYNENYINAPFYTNHDMARSAGYYTGKTASDSTKLAGALNLLMSGNAFIYYGEELGMKGSGKDENKRAPMPWGEEGSEGMTKGPKDMDKTSLSYGTLEEQTDDPSSIYNYYKKAIRIRNAFPVIARGKCSIIDSLSGDRFVTWKKDATAIIGDPSISDQVVLIILNNGKEPVTIDLSKDPLADGFRTLGASLVTEGDEITLNESTLTVPSFGIAVITKTD